MRIKDRNGNILREEYKKVIIRDYPEHSIVLYVPTKRLDEFVSFNGDIVWGKREEVETENY